MLLWTKEAVHDKMARVTRSPRLAAMGVATLSGFTSNLLDTVVRKTRMTRQQPDKNIVSPPMTKSVMTPRTKLAMEAVMTPDGSSNRILSLVKLLDTHLH